MLVTPGLFRHRLVIVYQWLFFVTYLSFSMTLVAQEPVTVKTQVAEVDPVILLVPGIVWHETPNRDELGEEFSTVPENWRSMTSFLQRVGYPFGGVIHPERSHQFSLPDCLDVSDAATSDVSRGRLFFLNFSPAADADGLISRSLELSLALKEIKKLTGRPIRIVAHSAGGLISRIVTQKAAVGIEYRGEVDRLITIATPHHGAAIASNFGDLIGTRATSLRPESPLIQRLNTQALRNDICYCSLVVRTVGTVFPNPGYAYREVIDQDHLKDLPADFRTGGDDVVHVQSQNLRLSQCVKAYEQDTSRAVQAVILRIPRPTIFQGLFDTPHNLVLKDRGAQLWVERLLSDDGSFWTEAEGRIDKFHRDWQQTHTAYGLIEEEAHSLAKGAEVSQVVLIQFKDASDPASPTMKQFQFLGEAHWVNYRFGATQVGGVLKLKFDPFGRVIHSRYARR